MGDMSPNFLQFGRTLWSLQLSSFSQFHVIGNCFLGGLVRQLVDLCRGNQWEFCGLCDEVTQFRTHVSALVQQPVVPSVPAPRSRTLSSSVQLSGLILPCLILPGLILRSIRGVADLDVLLSFRPHFLCDIVEHTAPVFGAPSIPLAVRVGLEHAVLGDVMPYASLPSSKRTARAPDADCIRGVSWCVFINKLLG